MADLAFDLASPPDKGIRLLPAYNDFATKVGFSPTWLAYCDEETGNLRDAVANNNLTAAGTILYKNYKNGYQGIAITANTSGFSANVNDFANTNSLFGGWFTVDDAVASQRTIMGRYAGTIYCLISIQTSGAGGGLANKILIQATDGVTAKSFTLNKVMTDGVRRLILVHIDRTGTTLRGSVSAPGEATVTGSVDITGWGTLTGGAGPLFNLGYVSGIQNGDDCWLGGAFCRINADMTGAGLIGSTATRLMK